MTSSTWMRALWLALFGIDELKSAIKLMSLCNNERDASAIFHGFGSHRRMLRTGTARHRDMRRCTPHGMPWYCQHDLQLRTRAGRDVIK